MLRLLKSIALLLSIASPAVAFDISAMTNEERSAFRSEIRNYLLENPELIIEVIGVLESRQAQASKDSEVQMITAYSDEIFDDGYSYVDGNPDGSMRIVEFLDYRCGYCRKAHPELLQMMADDDTIALVIKELPILGEQSVIASRFAIATRMIYGGDAYKSVHDALMNLQGNVSEPVLRRLAGEFELDADQILSEMTSDAVTNEINRNRQLAGALSIDGTPTFIVGTEALRGYVPMDQFIQILDELRG